MKDSLKSPSLETSEQGLIIETAAINPDDYRSDNAPTDKYSDYEIDVTSEQVYEDALFNDIDELDAALKHKPKYAEIASPTTEAAITETVKTIDLTALLPQLTLANKFKAEQHLFSNETPHLPISRLGLNYTTLTNQQYFDQPIFADYTPPPDEMLISNPNQQETKQLAPSKYPWLHDLSVNLQKQLQNSREKFDCYWGRSLPERTIPLGFNTQKLKAKNLIEPIASAYDVRRLCETKGIKSLHVLEHANQELTKISRCKLPFSQKHTLLTRYSQYLPAHINGLINSFHKKPTVANNPQRTELAELAKSAIKALITSYKQLYSLLYHSANVLYGPRRQTANQLAYQLIDWLCFEQRLYIAMQTPVAENSIKTMNQLFIVLTHYEPELIDEIRPSITLDETSLSKLFIQFQLLLIVPYQQLSTHYQPALLAYINQYSHTVEIIVKSNVLPRLAGWIIDQQLDHPARFCDNLDDANNSDSPAIYLWIGRYFKNLNQQYLNSVTKTTPPAASKIVLNALYKGMQNNIQHAIEQHYSMFKTAKLTVYSGLDNCAAYHYALIDSHQAAHHKAAIEHKYPTPTPCKTEWLVGIDDDRQQYLQAQEINAGLNIDIGTPMIIRATSDEKIEHYQLAIVSRLTRELPGYLNLVLNKLTTDFIAVTLSAETTTSSTGLLYQLDNNSYLICNNSDTFWKGKVIEITLADNSTWHICIKALFQESMVSNTYLLF